MGWNRNHNGPHMAPQAIVCPWLSKLLKATNNSNKNNDNNNVTSVFFNFVLLFWNLDTKAVRYVEGIVHGTDIWSHRRWNGPSRASGPRLGLVWVHRFILRCSDSGQPTPTTRFLSFFLSFFNVMHDCTDFIWLMLQWGFLASLHKVHYLWKKIIIFSFPLAFLVREREKSTWHIGVTQFTAIELAKKKMVIQHRN